MIQYEASLRPKNQLTIPDAVVQRLGAHPGDQLLFEIDEENGVQVRVRVIRRSYAGVLAGVYGSPDERAEYLREERASWVEGA